VRTSPVTPRRTAIGTHRVRARTRHGRAVRT
jgi:hypothetical protein